MYTNLAGQPLHKGLERCHYSSCSIGIQLTYPPAFSYICFTLRRDILTTAHGLHTAPSVLCARWARSWFVLAYCGNAVAAKFAYSCTPGFLGKKKTTQVTAPYQILPLCEEAAPWDYMYTGHTKTLSRAVVFIIVTLYRDSCAIWTSLASLIRIPYRPLARQLSLVQIMDTSGCITMCRVLFTKIIKLLAGTIWRV